jgi:predicted RND superfamily exporter protein
MILSIALIGLATLGSICFTGAALDVISSPAVIVCLLLAIDIVIHVVIAIRQNYQERIFKPVLAIIFITSIGFSSLCFSQFTPMQHFGLIMLLGMVFTGLMTMIVMPTIIRFFE